ncbi:MAG: hypothetical protein AAB818_03150, partial [Patescibacteria group bacterium]
HGRPSGNVRGSNANALDHHRSFSAEKARDPASRMSRSGLAKLQVFASPPSCSQTNPARKDEKGTNWNPLS